MEVQLNSFIQPLYEFGQVDRENEEPPVSKQERIETQREKTRENAGNDNARERTITIADSQFDTMSGTSCLVRLENETKLHISSFLDLLSISQLSRVNTVFNNLFYPMLQSSEKAISEALTSVFIQGKFDEKFELLIPSPRTEIQSLELFNNPTTFGNNQKIVIKYQDLEKVIARLPNLSILNFNLAMIISPHTIEKLREMHPTIKITSSIDSLLKMKDSPSLQIPKDLKVCEIVDEVHTIFNPKTEHFETGFSPPPLPPPDLKKVDLQSIFRPFFENHLVPQHVPKNIPMDHKILNKMNNMVTSNTQSFVIRPSPHFSQTLTKYGL